MADTKGQPDNRLSITRTTVDGVTVLTVGGEIDHDTAPQLHDALIDSGSVIAPRIVLELSAVTFMDSSGINTLVKAHRAADRVQGWIRLAALTEPVLRVIELVGVDLIITCYPTLPEALNG
ncbi:STAS domain-containing protein [Streptomyces sp. NPDC047079]|uniref:STAS domain-containing protein n=1 Tax=Streptomyces sp. NPDC047079 TaxID=3154607 RepID=UPI0033FECD96